MQEWINNVPGLGKKCLIKAEEIFCDSYSDMLCCDELKLFISECQLDADGMYSNTLQQERHQLTLIKVLNKFLKDQGKCYDCEDDKPITDETSGASSIVASVALIAATAILL